VPDSDRVGLPTVAKVVSRTPDPIWPAPDAPDVKKARTKPRPQPQQAAAADDAGATSSKAAAAKGKGGSKKGKR
jgi:hypothetical protein